MLVMMVSQGALMEYQAKRGGKVVLQDITKPTRMEWGTPLEAMTAVLELEKTVRMEEDYVMDLLSEIPCYPERI